MPILKAYNLDLTDDQEYTTIATTAAAASGTLTVKSITGFADNSNLLVGEWGDEDAEILQINGAPSGTTLTLNANTVNAHAVGTRVYRIDFDQVEFSRAATSGGAKTAFTKVGINATSKYTTYNDTENTTGYWYYRYFDTSTTWGTDGNGPYSGEYTYLSTDANSVKQMTQEALDMTNESYGKLITFEYLVDQLNSWQREVQRMRNWNWEITQATETVNSGQEGYALSDIATDFKHTHEGSGVTEVRIYNYDALRYQDNRQYNAAMLETIRTTISADIALLDTTVTLTDSSNFASAGIITIDDDDITYTANDTSTGILTVTASTITSTHTSGDTAWQKSSLGQPLNWTVFEDTLYIEPVADTTYDGYTMYVDYHKQLANLTTELSTTEIPFYNLAPYFLAWKIELRKGTKDMADYYRQIYENRLMAEIKRDQPVYYSRFTLAPTKGKS